jgi:hypothetical protein
MTAYVICEGLRTPARREIATGTRAGVGKPPGKEPAGGCALSVAGAVWERRGMSIDLKRAW